MNEIEINQKWFTPLFNATQINNRIDELAAEMNTTLRHQNPLFVVVLGGAYIFAADLLRKITVAHEVTFVKINSYHGTKSSGKINLSLSPAIALQGRHVIFIEDIIDSGLSMEFLLAYGTTFKPLTQQVVTLLFKPKALKTTIVPNWVGFEIEPAFVLGYGLDFDEKGRNLPHIYVETEPIK